MPDETNLDWLNTALSGDADLSFSMLTVRMGLALVLGGLVGGTHRLTRGRAQDATLGLVATLVMLTVLVAMMTLVIGNNVARAFGVVGALAIVRFRTNVEDTRDTAFVIFAVAVGTAVGAGYLRVPLVGVPVAMIAALLFRTRDEKISPAAMGSTDGRLACTVTARIGLGPEDGGALKRLLAERGTTVLLVSVESARQGSALEHIYTLSIPSRDDLAPLAAALNTAPGVQSVKVEAPI